MVESSASSSSQSLSQQTFPNSRISRNPYAQRSVIPLQQRTPPIGPTTTSTITDSYSSTSNNATKTSEQIRPSPLSPLPPHEHHHDHYHRCHRPSPTALNEYDIDDAMIDEYAACYDNDKPPDEFDDTLLFGDEDYEHVQSSSEQQAILTNKNESDECKDVDARRTIDPSSTNVSRPMVTFREEVDSNDDYDGGGKDAVTLTSVRQTRLDAPSVARQRKDLYKFERYIDHSLWREERIPSPMRAKKWKDTHRSTSNCVTDGMDIDDHHDSAAMTMNSCTRTHTNPQSIDRNCCFNSKMPTTSDAMLLWFLQRRQYGYTSTSNKWITKPKHCSLPMNPTIGKTCVPMTLGDGTRVHIPVHANATNKHHESFNNYTVSSYLSTNKASSLQLGASIELLLSRVNMNRRKHEYDKVVQETILVPTDRIDVDNKSNKDRPSISTSPTSVFDRQKWKNNVSTSQLWVDKHAPRTFAHLLSDERCNREVVHALRAWDPYVFHREPPKRPDTFTQNKFHKQRENQSIIQNKTADSLQSISRSKDKRPDETSRVILLSGPPGVGKTTLAHIVARHVGYRPVEVNGSDERTETALTDRVIRAMESSTIQFESASGDDTMHNRPNCLILDEIDGADAAKAIQALVEIIRADIPSHKTKKKQQYLRRPIIFICNNKFAPALKPLLPYTKQFDIHPPSTTRLVARLRSIVTSENLSLSSGGNSLLNQLVITSCGDIRSCLYTLQFASTRAKDIACDTNTSPDSDDDHLDTSHVPSLDISKAVQAAISGNGLKDARNDIVGTITSIFHRDKTVDSIGKHISGTRDCSSSVDKVHDIVRSFGDNSRVLDGLFINILRVSYIDPSFDRCCAALEWMSSTDTYRSNQQLSSADGYYVESIHTPTIAAVVHILCRVEQPKDLVFSIRDLTNSQYQMESNKALIQKFLDGLCLRAKSTRTGIHRVAIETIPHTLWILSAGQGSSALSRSVTSIELLNKGEQKAFGHHVDILRALGLKYVSFFMENDQDQSQSHYHNASQPKVRFDPPIERLIKFVDISNDRLDIPPALKQLLSRKVLIEKNTEKNATAQHLQPIIKVKAAPIKMNSNNNFLLVGAKNAKASRSARTAARVGCIVTGNNHQLSNRHDQTNEHKRLSNTGSGILLSRVVRLKYVKGFTQAVSMPCRLDDIS